MAKTDLKQQFKSLYRPPVQPVVVDVPSLNFLMIDGSGSPEQSERFQSAIGALYGIAYKDRPDASREVLQQLGDPYQRIGVDAGIGALRLLQRA